jgi:eukaryotic-like serine/threonine-protein kinase
VGDGGREPTQSLHLEPGEQPVPSDLALGTHNRVVTRIESPNGRGKTPAPPPSSNLPPLAARRFHGPDDYLGAELGSYRVIELLGKGGMGYVYRAEHIKLGREVALKLLRSDYAMRRDAVARFFQEARTVNRVRHRNIVDVTDFVELDDGTTYIIMELLTGTSLGTWARTGIDLPRALAVLVQICDGLGAAHQVGVVHRDLKPDNVIVVPTSDGAELVKVLDFGVAKLLNRDDEDVGFQTAAGSVIGTPAYMSPEQAGGMVIDARSDIYSLGAIMYELFCGQPMFRGRSFGEYVRKHLTENPVPPRQTPGGAHLEPPLEAVILRCLEKDPDQRFAHIVELREALLHLLGGMETYPPGVAQITASGHRPSMLQLPQMVSGSYLPSQISGGYVAQVAPAPQAAYPSGARRPGSTAIADAHPSQLSSISGSQPSSLAFRGQYSDAPAPARTMGTPWWLWAAGSAVAVTLGIGAAVWYAGRATPSLDPRPAPSIAATAPVRVPPLPASGTADTAPPRPAPAAVLPPQLVEVRFDSLPSGGVFADGHPAELCRTPCAFNIDLSDGGSADHRGFVVRRDGYTDAPITVDLTTTKREYRVVLQQAAAPAVTATDRTDRTDARPDKRSGKHAPRTSRKDPAAARDAARETAARDPAAARDAARETAARDAAAKETAARDAAAKDHERDRLIDPTGGKPAPAKPTNPRIDAADTLDPFHKK